MEEVKFVAYEWYNRVVWIQYGHYKSALYFSRRHSVMGSITVLMTAVIGTSVFATLAKQADLLVLVGALSVMATLLSALQTFLSYGERAERHKIAGSRYGKVGRQLELLLAHEQFDQNELVKIKEQLDSLSQECPHIPDKVNKLMEKKPPLGLKFSDK